MDILRGLPGLLVILLIGYLFSIRRSAVSWRLVISGLTLQIIIALLVFQVPFFTSFFNSVGTGLVKFLSFGLDGAAFIFGDLVRNSDTQENVRHNLGFVFAFQALPIVVFFSSVTALLYHFGILQKVVYGMAWLMSKTMKLSGSESLSAAGNVFMGQTEAPLLVRPFIPHMTKSELHCLMTGGMATIAGTVMGAYVSMLGGGSEEEQIRFASYLLGASLMNAPAAIVMSKMFYPETSEVEDELKLNKEKTTSNAIDALAVGASDGMKLALNIGAMLLAFIGVVYAVNWFLADGIGVWFDLNSWVVTQTGGAYDSFSLEFILGQAFRGFAYLIGVSWEESLYVGSLLGQKLVINEFFAYSSFSMMIPQGILSEKSILITTYALCGFANFSSIAIQIGGIGSMAPSRQKDISRLGMRSLMAATLATMMTATIVGMIA